MKKTLEWKLKNLATLFFILGFLIVTLGWYIHSFFLTNSAGLFVGMGTGIVLAMVIFRFHIVESKTMQRIEVH